MKFEYLLIFVLVLFIIAGCATFKETLGGIKDDSEAFKAEAKAVSDPIGTAFPGIPYAACVGIGYAISFARRMYKNFKKERDRSKDSIKI